MYIFCLAYLLLLSVLFACDTSRSKKLFLLCSFAFLTLISGFRGETVGIDTANYIYALEKMSVYGYRRFCEIWNPELGYGFLLWLNSVSVDNMQVSFFVFALFTSVSFAVFIYRYSLDVRLSTMLYFLFVFPRGMNICRMYVAISCFLFCFNFIMKRKCVFAFLMIAIASLFHQSALFLMPLIALCFVKKFDWKKNGFLLFIGFALLVFFSSFFELFGNSFAGERYAHYANTAAQYSSSVTWKYACIYACTAIASLYLLFRYDQVYKVNSEMRCMKSLDESKKAFGFLFVFFIWSIVFLVLASSFFILDRLYDYFLFSFIVVLPNVIQSLLYGYERLSVKLVALVLLVYAGMNSILHNIAGVYPYVFFFS